MPVLPATTIHAITVLPESSSTVTPSHPRPSSPSLASQAQTPRTTSWNPKKCQSLPVRVPVIQPVPSLPTCAHTCSFTAQPARLASHLVPPPPSQSRPSPICSLGLAHSHHFTALYYPPTQRRLQPSASCSTSFPLSYI